MAGPGQLRQGSTNEAYAKIASEQHQEQQARERRIETLKLLPGGLIIVGMLGYLLSQAW